MIDVTKYLTARQAAERLGLSPVTIRRAFREGRLVGHRVRTPGRPWSVILIDPSSVDSYRTDHKGRFGPIRRTCLECGVRFPVHVGAGHTYRPDPRLEVA